MKQRDMALAAYGIRMRERRTAREIEQVRQWIDDDRPISQELRDAIRLPVAVLTLPKNYGRFVTLLADAQASIDDGSN